MEEQLSKEVGRRNKNFIKRPLFLAGCTAIISVSVAVKIGGGTAIFVSAALFVCGLLLAALRKPEWLPGIAIFFVASAVFSGYYLYDMTYYQPIKALVDRTIDIEGIVEDCVQMDYGSKYQLKAKVPFYPGTAPIDWFTNRRNSVRMTLYSFGEPAAEMGDTITCTATIGLAQYDNELGKGILLHGFEKNGIYKRADSQSPTAILLRARKQMLDKTKTLYSPKVRGMVQAMVLGYRLEMDYEVRETINISGVGHILAVSGLHVSIVFQVVLLMLVQAGLTKKKAALCIIPFLYIFMGITGFSPSVLRAGIMSMISCIAILLEREYDILSALGFAILCILMINPFYVLNIGFLLSVGAMLGIALFSNHIQDFIIGFAGIGRWIDNRKEKGLWLEWFVQSISVSLSVYIFSIPLLVYAFGRIPVLTAITTALVIWLMTPIVLLGFTSLIVVYASRPGRVLARSLALIVEVCSRGILYITAVMAEIPFAVIYTKALYVIVWSIGFIAVLLWLRKMNWKRDEVIFYVLICSILLCYTGMYQFTQNINVLEFASTENALVITKNGRGVVIGDVRSDYEASEVALALRCKGVKKLDIFLSDQASLDESDGLDTFLKEFPPELCILPEKGKYLDFINRVRKKGNAFKKLDNLQCGALGNVILTAQRTAGESYRITIQYNGRKVLKTVEDYAIIKDIPYVCAIYGEENTCKINPYLNGYQITSNAAGEQILLLE